MPLTLTTEELVKFTLPHELTLEETLRASIKANKKMYKKALIIGRFQPLHRGHIFLITCALQIAESVVICIGSINKNDIDNPFSQHVRKNLIDTAIQREKLMIESIIYSHDTPDDKEWLNEILAQVPDIDVVVGNNEWVNGIFSKAGISVVEIPLLKREHYEGKTIRNKLRIDGKL